MKVQRIRRFYLLLWQDCILPKDIKLFAKKASSKRFPPKCHFITVESKIAEFENGESKPMIQIGRFVELFGIFTSRLEYFPTSVTHFIHWSRGKINILIGACTKRNHICLTENLRQLQICGDLIVDCVVRRHYFGFSMTMPILHRFAHRPQH